MRDVLQQLRNAITIIKQIRKGEWKFEGHFRFDNEPEFTCFTAHRNDIELWVASGAWNCEIRGRPWELGVFGHLVWHFGAKQNVRRLERRMKRRPSDLSGAE
jgi:hypothetical protein